MAIGTVEFDLSMVSPESGEFLTARAYTVEGVTNVDGSPRLLSIGQLVMAICLQRASRLEIGVWDETQQKYVDGIIPLMEEMSATSAQLAALTEIENDILDGGANMDNINTSHVTYDGRDYTFYDFLVNVMKFSASDVPTGFADGSNTDLITLIESKMDEKNSFSQQKMIELQSLTNKRDQSYDMISNILKSLNTTMTGIVNNT
jgi:hypothetical protein